VLPRLSVCLQNTIEPEEDGDSSKRWSFCVMGFFNVGSNTASSCYRSNIADIQRCFHVALDGLSTQEIVRAFTRDFDFVPIKTISVQLFQFLVVMVPGYARCDGPWIFTPL